MLCAALVTLMLVALLPQKGEAEVRYGLRYRDPDENETIPTVSDKNTRTGTNVQRTRRDQEEKGLRIGNDIFRDLTGCGMSGGKGMGKAGRRRVEDATDDDYYYETTAVKGVMCGKKKGGKGMGKKSKGKKSKGKGMNGMMGMMGGKGGKAESPTSAPFDGIGEFPSSAPFDGVGEIPSVTPVPPPSTPAPAVADDDDNFSTSAPAIADDDYVGEEPHGT